MNWRRHLKIAKNSENGEKWASTFTFKSSYNFKAKEKFMRIFFVQTLS